MSSKKNINALIIGGGRWGEVHYNELSKDWRLIASNTYSIVAGFSENNSAYLIDIVLLTTNPDEIVKRLNQE